MHGLSRTIGLLSMVLSCVVRAGDLGEPAYVEGSKVMPLGLLLHLETHCEKVKPLKRVSGEEPKWPQTPGVVLNDAVQVRCIVLRDGTVRQCRMSGPPALEATVLTAVNHWRFEPYRKRGQEVPVKYLFTLYTKNRGKPHSAPFARGPSTRMDGRGSCLFEDEEVFSNTPASRGPGEMPHESR
jgi:TonB family protein